MYIPDLNRLRVFASIYEAGGITASASKLSVTPSAVSQSLSLLEDETGIRLFQRIGRSMKATDAGVELYGIWRRQSQELDRCLSALRAKPDELRGTLKIGAPAEFGARQAIIAGTKLARREGVRLEFTYGLPDDLIRKVISQELDLAFCDSGPYLAKYDRVVARRTIFEEEAQLVCSPEFARARLRGDHSYANLIALPHCDYRPDAKVLQLWYRHHFGKAPAGFDLRITGSQVRAMVEAAKNGVGLAFIPTHLIESELKTKKLVVVPGRKAPYVNPIHLIQLAGKVPNALEKAYLGGFRAGAK